MPEVLRLKKSNCKNCYKCIRHCPVKSIRFSGNQAHVESEACVLCGQCFVHCPQNAKEIIDGCETVRVLLQSGVPVIASLAPSFVANYPGCGIEDLRSGLLQLGFADAEETALGATLVKQEYERLLNENPKQLLLSSCCHSVNLLIRKYFPAALPFLAKVVTPMEAHARDIKRRNPAAKVVFVGPCLAKKDECKHSAFVDAALTFEELSALLQDSTITLKPNEQAQIQEKSRARLFPTAGGILKTLEKHPDIQYLALDGMETCMTVLKEIDQGTAILEGCFIELSACSGSCIGGPIMEKYGSAPLRNFLAVLKAAGAQDFDVRPTEPAALAATYAPQPPQEKRPTDTELGKILKQMGKLLPSDFLDCGTCGYDTCRDKAIAVFQGKAEISMCLPYLKTQAENVSDIILQNTPNGILTLNETLEVQQINKAAMRILSLSQPSDILGEHVVRILDPGVFYDVLESGKNSHQKHVFLSEYDKHVEQTIVYDQEVHALICILRDITEKEHLRTQKEQARRKTSEIADEVVGKQMKIVQEIASLLGETAAETKIALTRLKESIES